jgi:ligand-binding sensor domain-containing protein
MPTDKIYRMSEDSLGFLWLATDQGLLRFDGTTCAPVALTSPSGKSVTGMLTDVYVDMHHDLWIGTATEGLVRFTPQTGEVNVFSPDPKDPQTVPTGRTYNFSG